MDVMNHMDPPVYRTWYEDGKIYRTFYHHDKIDLFTGLYDCQQNPIFVNDFIVISNDPTEDISNKAIGLVCLGHSSLEYWDDHGITELPYYGLYLDGLRYSMEYLLKGDVLLVGDLRTTPEMRECQTMQEYWDRYKTRRELT